MKKSLLLFLCTLLCAASFAQDSITKPGASKYAYCQIVGTGRLLSNKVTIEIDFGQFRSVWEDNRLKDPKTGDRIIFNSMIDALNFMGNQGWEFVQAYAFAIPNSGNVYHYLLKKQKKIIEEEEKEYGKE
jgi:hypothetical protein